MESLDVSPSEITCRNVHPNADKAIEFFFSKVVIQSTTLNIVLQSNTLKSCKHR